MTGLIPFNNRRNYLVPRNPFSMMDDFFSDFWPLGRPLMRNTINDVFGNTFKVDVQESDGAYTVEAEMPGVQKEDIKLSFDEGRLTIGVQRDESTENDKDGYIHRERHYSSMQRSLYMAEAGDTGIEANLTDGILKIVLPKKAKQDGVTQIEIN